LALVPASVKSASALVAISRGRWRRTGEPAASDVRDPRLGHCWAIILLRWRPFLSPVVRAALDPSGTEGLAVDMVTAPRKAIRRPSMSG
jgi:hypothetical protein